MFRRHTYVLSLLAGHIAALTTIGVGFWLVPFTLRHLEREQFGVFALIGELLTWLALLDLGFSASASVQAAHLAAQGEKSALGRLISTLLVCQLTLALLVVLSGVALGGWVPDFFGVSPVERTATTHVFRIMTLGLATSMVSKVFSAVLIANEELYLDHLVRTGVVVLRALITVLLLRRDLGLLALAVAHLAAQVAALPLLAWRASRLVRPGRIGLGGFSWPTLTDRVGVSLWFGLAGCAGVLISHLDQAVTARLLSVETVATLALTSKPYLVLLAVLQQGLHSARPVLARMFGQRDELGLARLHARLCTISTALAVVLGLTVLGVNEGFVVWWAGARNYGGIGLDAALVAMVVSSVWVLAQRVFLASSLQQVPQHTLSRFLEGGVNLGLSVFLGSVYGVAGVVAGTALAAGLTSAWYLPRLCRLVAGGGGGPTPLSMLRPSLGCLVVMAPLALWLRSLGRIEGGLPGVAARGVVLAVFGFACVWWWALAGPTRKAAWVPVREGVKHALARDRRSALGSTRGEVPHGARHAAPSATECRSALREKALREGSLADPQSEDTQSLR